MSDPSSRSHSGQAFQAAAAAYQQGRGTGRAVRVAYAAMLRDMLGGDELAQQRCLRALGESLNPQRKVA